MESTGMPKDRTESLVEEEERKEKREGERAYLKRPCLQMEGGRRSV